MSLKQIERRIRKLEEKQGPDIEALLAEVLQHWEETGELGCADGSPVPLAVTDLIIERGRQAANVAQDDLT
jgi:hypothetical protein